MAKAKRSIRFRINLPSVGLGKFWRKAVFDPENFKLFMENTNGFLENQGVRLDPSVDRDALMRLRFTAARLRSCVVDENISIKQFEKVFGIFTPEAELRDVSVFREAGSNRQAEREVESQAAAIRETSAEVYYSEKQSESHRGANTEWDKHDALTHSHSDHWSTTKFETDGKQILYPDDQFQRTPLLDIWTLSRILTQMEIRLKEFGDY